MISLWIENIEIGYIARKVSTTLECFYSFSINVAFSDTRHAELCHLTFMQVCKTLSPYSLYIFMYLIIISVH